MRAFDLQIKQIKKGKNKKKKKKCNWFGAKENQYSCNPSEIRSNWPAFSEFAGCIAIITIVTDGKRCKVPCVWFHISCTTAATRRAPFWRRSASSSNNKAVRQPQPLGALGKGMPVCLKRPNTITSLFDGQINWIVIAYEPQSY